MEEQNPGAAKDAGSGMDIDQETATAEPGSVPNNPCNPPQHQNAWDFLSLARQHISQGKPSLALQAVVTAMRYSGGEAAVFQTLNRARELYRNKLQANGAVEELASLFAECAIAEAQPIRSEPVPFDTGGAPPMLIPNFEESSILAESGRKQMVLDAFLDGSSFICLRCGGLFCNLRKDEHLQYWCNQI